MLFRDSMCQMWLSYIYYCILFRFICEMILSTLKKCSCSIFPQKSIFYSIWRPSCKKGVYRVLADFHFLQDRANFWQTDLFWHEKFRNCFSQFALSSPEITYAKRFSFAWSGIIMSKSFEGRFWRNVNLNDYF